MLALLWNGWPKGREELVRLNLDRLAAIRRDPNYVLLAYKNRGGEIMDMIMGYDDRSEDLEGLLNLLPY